MTGSCYITTVGWLDRGGGGSLVPHLYNCQPGGIHRCLVKLRQPCHWGYSTPLWYTLSPRGKNNLEVFR